MVLFLYSTLLYLKTMKTFLQVYAYLQCNHLQINISIVLISNSEKYISMSRI